MGNFLRKALLESIENLVCELGSPVEGRHDHRHVKVRVVVAVANRRDRVHELCATVQREVGQRDRNHDFRGGAQDVEGQRSKRRRRVEENEVVGLEFWRGIQRSKQPPGRIRFVIFEDRKQPQGFVGRDHVELRYSRGRDRKGRGGSKRGVGSVFVAVIQRRSVAQHRIEQQVDRRTASSARSTPSTLPSWPWGSMSTARIRRPR